MANTESEALKVFLCGNSSYSSPKERNLLGVIEDLFAQSGANIVNKSLIAFNLRELKEGDRELYELELAKAWKQAECLYADITTENPEVMGQLWYGNNVLKLPTGLSYQAGKIPRFPDLRRVLWSQPWFDIHELRSGINQFVTTIRPTAQVRKAAVSPPDPNEFSNGELKIYRDAKAVHFAGEKLDIGPFKYALLETMSRNLDEITTYLAIQRSLARVAGIGFRPMEHIRKRTKESIHELTLQFGDHRYFETYYGAGYRLVDVDALERLVPGGVLKNGDLEYNLVSGTVTVGGEAVELGSMHERLLQAFMTNVGAEISYDRMLDLGWGKIKEGAKMSTVRTGVWELKSRLAQVEGGQKYIQNIKGGYSMPNFAEAS